MEERKTAAIVLPIVALIFIYIFWLMPYMDLKKAHILSFKTCTVEFKYRYAVDTAEDAYVQAQNDLGLCLAETYVKKPDTALAGHIMMIYKRYGRNICPDTLNQMHYDNLDSVLKYRNIAFKPLFAWD